MPQQLVDSSPLTVDEGTFFDFEAATISATHGVIADVPLPRVYRGDDGQLVEAAADTWPLEYDSVGRPIGRQVRGMHQDEAGQYGVYNAVTFDSVSWFTATGTLLIAVTPLDDTSNFARVLEFSNGSPAARIGLLRHGSDCVLRVENANRQVLRLNGGPLLARQYNKIAMSYTTNAWRLSVNGGDEIAASSGAVPVVTEGHIGGLRGIASNMMMHGIRHWDVVKGNLKGMSAL